jgi:nitrite reductase/ring-hydroxylating ferredoxin subunit/DMSO/TMAO reductase YedYZ heme-binding membrane subunit
MSVGFRAVQWNRDKLIYDAILVVGIAVYVTGYMLIAWRTEPPKTHADAIDLWIRATGSCAFLMLTIILCIGPLARLDRRFLALLYNRRHFGVLTFLVALVHFGFLLDWYISLHALPNLAVELTKWPDYLKFIGFPFKALGLAALLILFLLASTSHDFWLMFLTPRVWKFLHMALYVAYGLIVMHVALGHMQDERSPLVPIALFGALALVATLHLVAGWRERKIDRAAATTGWLTVGPLAAIPDKRARIVTAPGGERIAVFRDGAQVGAVTNLCAHQNGPLGEGRIIDGCITCPWHGYQYRLADGCAPPPFTEKLATHRVRIERGLVMVDPTPLAPGTPAAIVVANAPTGAP